MSNIQSRLRSFRFAWQGIMYLLRTQPNARIHLVMTICVLIASIGLKITAAEWCWICAAIAAVWSIESINTAVELIVDLVSPDFHPLAGNAKDVCAAAVLFVAFGAAAVGILILGPRIVHHFL